MLPAFTNRLRALLAHDTLRFATLVAVASFLLDWATKTWALESIGEGALPLGALALGVERNDAFAFSMGAGEMPAVVVVAVRVIALAAVIALSVRVGVRNRRLATGFALLIGGGSGNAADVLFRGGSVVDFIHAGPFHMRGELVHAGFVFNAADLSILLALGLLAPLIQEWSLGGQRRIAAWEARWLRARRGAGWRRGMTEEPARRDPTGVRRLAWFLDDVIRIPGTNIRFGIDPLLGLIPGGGDLAGGVLSGYIVLAAARAGAPPSVLIRMGVNVMIDALAGSVPLLGDVFDAGWKANRRNAALLEQHVASPGPVETRSRAVLVLVLSVLALVVIGAAVLSIALVRWIVGQL